ncbi:hypothetical protein [Xanthomonas melonis]|uniref:hypothetical protein n=1 Tax=Xanthomonas melonis TaxID=56456 RepID=UPI001E480D7F|nr:hypothetical protein [Xanthomonas melonis]MCD0245181.1 hypothetical protein [Xanthomonas melonis]
MPGNFNGYVGDDVAIFLCGVRKMRRRPRAWLIGESARRRIAVNPCSSSVQWIGAAIHRIHAVRPLRRRHA